MRRRKLSLSLLGLGILAAWFITSCSPTAEKEAAEVTGFVGSKACAECHDKFYRLWEPSTHGKAMREFDATFHRQHLTPHEQPIEIMGKRYQAFLDDSGGNVREWDADGSEKSYPIRFALGAKNVFFFLTPLERGILQVLPLAYDIRRSVWYDTSGSMLRNHSDFPDEPLEWTARQFTWNASCFSCHVSQLEKGYSLTQNAYETRWLETGINCETCHGPSAGHVNSARKHGDKLLPEQMQIIRWRDFDSEQINSGCSACHAKLRQLTGFFEPGGRFFDYFGLVTLEDNDFYPDGRDLGENFTLTSFLMSPCLESEDLTCIHCHTSSGRMRQKGAQENQMCAPCHQEIVESPAEHSFHKADSEGSRCVMCHMPPTEFARMLRHDHSMLPPVPAATKAFESPNACNICHQDQDAAWADDWVRRWYPRDFQQPLVYRGNLIHAARNQISSELPKILKYIDDGSANQVFRTSLIRLLERFREPEKWGTLIGVMNDDSPLVRSAAARALIGCPLQDASQALLKAVTDDYRSVRMEAAFALSHFPLDNLPGEIRGSVEVAFREFEEGLNGLVDDPNSKQILGLFYQNRGLLRRSAAAYRDAVRVDPTHDTALVNLSMVYAQLGEPEKSEKALLQALEINPDRVESNFNLGLLYAEMGRNTDAERYLRRALANDPSFAQAAYNLCVLLAGKSDLEEAVGLCRRAVQLEPEQPRYGFSLGFFLRQSGRFMEAATALERVLARFPRELDTALLLGQIYEEQGLKKRAEEVYRKALRAPLPQQTRHQLLARIEALSR